MSLSYITDKNKKVEQYARKKTEIH